MINFIAETITQRVHRRGLRTLEGDAMTWIMTSVLSTVAPAGDAGDRNPRRPRSMSERVAQ